MTNRVTVNAVSDYLENFEKIDLETRTKNRKPGLWVIFQNNNAKIALSPALTQQFGIKNNDRFDLYHRGKIFAFVRADAGLLKITKQENEQRARINSKSAISAIKALNQSDAIEYQAFIIDATTFIICNDLHLMPKEEE